MIIRHFAKKPDDSLDAEGVDRDDSDDSHRLIFAAEVTLLLHMESAESRVSMLFSPSESPGNGGAMATAFSLSSLISVTSWCG